MGTDISSRHFSEKEPLQYEILMFGDIPFVMFLTWLVKGKVKYILVHALRLCTGRTAHRGSRDIAMPFHDHGTRRGWGVSVTPWPLFTLGKDPVPIVQEAKWGPGSVWTGAENLVPTEIRSPDRPARSQLLYRLSYPAHSYLTGLGIYFVEKQTYFSHTLPRTYVGVHCVFGYITEEDNQRYGILGLHCLQYVFILLYFFVSSIWKCFKYKSYILLEIYVLYYVTF